jgi:hypothetical protein
MQPAYIVIKVILIGFTLAANAYYLLSIVAGFKFFSRPQEKEGGELLPVAIMIPLHGADFKAYDNYARLVPSRTTRSIKSYLACVKRETLRCPS